VFSVGEDGTFLVAGENFAVVSYIADGLSMCFLAVSHYNTQYSNLTCKM
jgi:hypothetical protein